MSDDILEQQRASWDAAAPAWNRWYDWFDRGFAPVTKWLCDAVHGAERVRDGACGAGQPSIALAERGAQVVAIDLAPAMAEATAARARARGLEVDTRAMDATRLVFRDHSFDAATSRWGIMFPPEPHRAVAEIMRVVKPGGRFATVVWDLPEHNPMFTILQRAIATVVELPPPDRDAPGLFRLAAPGALREVLRNGGFLHLSIDSLSLTAELGTPDEFWTAQREISSALRGALATMAEDDVARVRDAVFSGLAPYVEGGRVRVPARCHVAVAS